MHLYNLITYNHPKTKKRHENKAELHVSPPDQLLPSFELTQPHWNILSSIMLYLNCRPYNG